MDLKNFGTWVLFFFDVVGVWMIVRPSDPVNLWTAHRALASDFDRFISRLVGVITLSAQVTQWAAQAKNTHAEPITHWAWIVFEVCAVVFLAYHLLVLLTSKPNQRTPPDQAKRRLLLPESEEEAKARYSAAWRKYRRLRVAFPVMFLGWLPFGYVLGRVFVLFNWKEKIWVIIMLACVPFMSILGWQWSFWQCPRCGLAFKGIYNPFFPKRCHYCGLPMWAESPDQ